MITLTGYEGVAAGVGHELGVSGWHEVTQAAVNAFADLTNDHQWIHVDPQRAAASPFGGTIAHGLYTLSLAPGFCEELFALDGFAFGMNYGYETVRFPAPLPVGSRVRMRATLSGFEPLDGGCRVVVTGVFERDGGEKPVCVAEMVFRLFE